MRTDRLNATVAATASAPESNLKHIEPEHRNMKAASFFHVAILLGCFFPAPMAAFGQQRIARPVAVDSAVRPRPLKARVPVVRIAPQAPVGTVDLGPVRPRPARSRPAGAYRDFRDEIGYVEDAAPGAFDAVTWTATSDGGRTCAVEFVAPGSTALRVRLRGAWETGLELRVYDPVSGQAFGPYKHPRLDENGAWWTTMIFGESIGLEFFDPDGEGSEPPPLPEMTAVAKHWSDDNTPTGSAPSCGHLDLLCSPSWVDEGDAVVQYSYVENGGSFVCTGALINRSPSDLAPLLLTADHCIDNQTTAATACFFWGYQNDACDASPPADNPNGFPRTDGAVVLKTRNNSDVSLLGLVEPPVADWWLGWDAGGWVLQSDANGIHHPAGSYKRYSDGDVTVALWVTYGQNNAHVWRVNWDSGSTEGGSSGSPVLDDSGRIRGQLKGGTDCGVGDYGRFGVSFDTLEPYLQDMASPVYVEAGVGGDQRGTSGDPFDTVYEATFCVFAGDEVRIRAGNYNEQFTLWRPMTLNADGGDVVIGAP